MRKPQDMQTLAAHATRGSADPETTPEHGDPTAQLSTSASPPPPPQTLQPRQQEWRVHWDVDGLHSSWGQPKPKPKSKTRHRRDRPIPSSEWTSSSHPAWDKRMDLLGCCTRQLGEWQGHTRTWLNALVSSSSNAERTETHQRVRRRIEGSHQESSCMVMQGLFPSIRECAQQRVPHQKTRSAPSFHSQRMMDHHQCQQHKADRPLARTDRDIVADAPGSRASGLLYLSHATLDVQSPMTKTLQRHPQTSLHTSQTTQTRQRMHTLGRCLSFVGPVVTLVHSAARDTHPDTGQATEHKEIVQCPTLHWRHNGTASAASKTQQHQHNRGHTIPHQ